MSIKSPKCILAVLTAAAIAGFAGTAKADGPFKIDSPAFADNAIMASKYAGKGGPRKCDGENVSPPLAWSGAPDGTKSFAIIVHDAAGNRGLGVTHWVGYGISADTNQLSEGALNAEGPMSEVSTLSARRPGLVPVPMPAIFPIITSSQSSRPIWRRTISSPA